ncbi:MAG TPA: DUF4097 family beta strand repeat-containing protein [Vicinamibacterales bacterium]|jgi:DUF4097 and DUF4098 domain-containing protein YvlB|nr:DUF4097 family beta strand repeat-containing protein [Vicinamibacterales bacterium]
MARWSPVQASLGVGLAALLFTGSACVDIVGAGMGRFVDRQEKSFTTTDRPDIDLSTFDGSIEIRPWDKSEVLVVIEKRARDKADADTIDVHADQTGNHVSVEAKVPDRQHGLGFSFHTGSRSARLIVSAPATANVIAKSGDGSIDIERITGRVELRSGDGSIRASGLHGDLRAHSGDGSIKVEGVNGGLDVDTGDGSISASGTFTSLRARSGDGAVTIHADKGSAPASDWDIVAGDGSVTLEVADGFSGQLDAHTGDGGIRLRDVTVSNVVGELSKHTVRGTMGSGGKAVRLRTGDGSITVRRF